MREWIGDYTFEVTFYDNNYDVVEKPLAAGRYGAIVKIKAEDGFTYTRFRTLYKSSQSLGLFYDQIEGELRFPHGMGWRTRVAGPYITAFRVYSKNISLQ